MAFTSTLTHQPREASSIAPTAVAKSPSAYARFAWGVLAFNLLVILWGAYVRASGSGAGCGNHWPLCNGEIVPRSPAIATLVELGHRLTSGAALLLVGALVVGARRRFPRGHEVRRAATWSAFFLVTEALIGAGLVLLELVAQNTSLARGYWVGGHLLNTFLLVASLTLTAWYASGAKPPLLTSPKSRVVPLAVALLSVLLLGISGAVTALGDTLFPASTLAEAEALTFSTSAHLFVRLRIWHPSIAAAVGILLLVAVRQGLAATPTTAARPLARALVALYATQILIGAANVWFLAPIGIQLAHLLLSHLIWVTLVLFAASVLAPPVVVSELKEKY